MYGVTTAKPSGTCIMFLQALARYGNRHPA
jgi:hypothetical protein